MASAAGVLRCSRRDVIDGELIAFGDEGLPSFARLCRRMLQRDRTVAVAFVLFDVLGHDGESMLGVLGSNVDSCSNH
jgi:ATP-dependent DNA ligase